MSTLIHKESTGDLQGWNLYRRTFYDEINYDICMIKSGCEYPAAHTFSALIFDPDRDINRKSEQLPIYVLDEKALEYAKHFIEVEDP